MPLLQIFADFQRAVTLGGNIIVIAHSQDASGNYVWDLDSRSVITEAALLRNYIAWESFLENSFVAYMMGEASITGNIVTRYIQPLNHDHANRMAIGAIKFVDWSTPDIVRKLSKLYFERGIPFDSVLASIYNDLIDLKTIRNAAAHISSTTSSKLDTLSTRKGIPITNISVSDFILSTDPISNTGETIFQAYMSTLSAAAYQIAHF